MARIVFGLATSHGPMLSTPPDLWRLRASADQKNQAHWYRGESLDYDSLLARRAPGFAAQLEPAAQQSSFDRCQRALDRLADRFAQAAPDVVLVLGNDQSEVFTEELVPAFTIYTGAAIENIPLSEEAVARLPPGIAIAEESHCPPGGATYAGAPELAGHLVSSLIDQEFDVATSTGMPRSLKAQEGIPHAFGYIYRRIMRDAPPPSVPIFTNVGVGLNRPRLRRCLAFGHALKRAIDILPADLRVAVVASGGLTHFCVDEELDRQVLDALMRRDEAALAAIPEAMFNGNTAEIRSWYPLAAAMHDSGLRMELLDYVACYRTPAGTGSAMGFAVWE
ncbi:Protocatechuate 4,5-dioxygenase beta chain [Pigmentiphaga humi]|uniref:Protocatechuate 4,5-dioxygenase beta chain n=1 Tax=Pigmentiphaga humi TaxID=2478468 RepID=A0A3P4AZT6_9BURK|nr:protocatechuate 3,4-dioxygenase [Pigmentiphaga humi]VCU68856.1 Protocatechuate 4,5-dioxygenase beta chain [Pigmentiphaga humi]